jgi:glyoxylase-like metal-dependent hydrolase (beta-lactamase superfamily II)
LLNQPAAKTEAALKKVDLTSPLELSGNSFLVNTGARLMLFDTGAGTLFGPTLGKLNGNLRSAGYQPEQIDDVFITHFHPDHVGGLMLDGKLAFPNATLHVNARDVAYWLDRATMAKAPESAKGFFEGAMASVNPWVAAARVQTFETDAVLVPGVTSKTSFGHTAGHTSYLVESKGQSLLIIGDLIHVPAVQLENPSVTIAYDSDAKAAASSRERLFTWASKTGALIAAAHLPFPGTGHLHASGKGADLLRLRESA